MSEARETPAAAGGAFRIGGELEVHRLGYGAMRVTGEGIWGDPPDRAAAMGILRRAVELGVTLIDTADAYGPDTNETLIADALHPYPADVVVATKGCCTRPGPGRWGADGRPAHLRAACEGSLRRLRLDAIPLYQLHTVDSDVPLEESVGALRDLQAEGKVRYVGLSNVSVAQLEAARTLVDVVTVQNRYSLADRTHEPVLERCAALGIGFLPWFPLAAGDLADGGGALDRVARARGATPAQVAIAWLLARAPVVLPIPGTSKVDHLEENVAAAALRLSADEIERLTAG